MRASELVMYPKIISQRKNVNVRHNIDTIRHVFVLYQLIVLTLNLDRK